MVEIIEFNSKKYRRYPESNRRSDAVYFKRSIKGGTRFLHRDIWEFHNGPIPDGFQIHHIDENPLNNELSNLACISAKEHRNDHPLSKEQYTKQVIHLAKINPLSKDWHSSEDGKKLHSRLGKITRENFVPIEKKCECCDDLFKTKKLDHSDKYCSNKCKSKHRRELGTDNVEKICKHCSSTFVSNKYAKVQYCSRSCSASGKWAKIKRV